MVSGSQNTAKSTFIQYLLNSMIPTLIPEIHVLDCDPGQPMFSLPGCVSLSKVTQSLLTNELTPSQSGVETIKSLYLDACSPALNMKEYISKIKTLMELFSENHKDGLLVINTCGWVDGLGKDLQR